MPDPTSQDHAELGGWSVILGPDQGIDRRHHTRKVPMSVLSLGFSRTGTLSMQEAFGILGIPSPYHYAAIFQNVSDTDLWNEAFETKFGNRKIVTDWKAHFDALLGHCGAVTDTPCMIFWKELIEAYPDAKVVLVERDEDKWFKSIEKLLEGMFNPMSQIFMYTDPFYAGKIFGTGYWWVKALYGKADLDTAKRKALPVYRKHYADIRAFVPKERLLDYKLGSGWEPLCEFLGKEVPKGVEFPHRNEAKTLDKAFAAFGQRMLKRSLLNLGVLVGTAAVLTGIWHKYGRH